MTWNLKESNSETRISRAVAAEHAPSAAPLGSVAQNAPHVGAATAEVTAPSNKKTSAKNADMLIKKRHRDIAAKHALSVSAAPLVAQPVPVGAETAEAPTPHTQFVNELAQFVDLDSYNENSDSMYQGMYENYISKKQWNKWRNIMTRGMQ